MSSFNNLLSRAYLLSEAKVSPYASAHPSFGAITSKMRAGGLSSAPLDTIKFIREILYYLDIIGDEELNAIKRGAGFTGKKQAMLNVLKAKQQEINAKTQEIADRVTSTLDDFINGVGTNRGREEKYAAQAAAQEIANQMRQAKSGKQMDDALTDIVADESLLVKTAVAKILADIQKNLGEPGFDIEEEALSEVIDYANKINSLATLKSFIQQIAKEPGYEKIAAYLSSAVKPISQGTEDEEMQEDAEDSVEAYYDPSGAGVSPEEYDEVMRGEVEDEEYDNTKADINDDGKVEGWEKGLAKKRGFKNVPTEDEEVTVAGRPCTVKYGDSGEIISVETKERGAHIDVALVNKYIKDGFPLSRAIAAATSYPNDTNQGSEDAMMMGESYTSMYLTEQKKKDSLYKPVKEQTVSFKDRYKPKTHWQLEELRRYGL